MFKVYMVFAQDSRYPLIIYKTKEQAEQWIFDNGHLYPNRCWIHEMYVEN